MLGCVADGDAEGSPNVAESLFHVKRKFLPGEDGFGLFGEERVNGRHQNIDNRSANENEQRKENNRQNNLDGDHAGVNPAAHVFGAALDDAVDPVANADAREYEGDHDDNVQNSGDEQISCELVCAYKTDGLDVCGKSGLELFCYRYVFLFHCFKYKKACDWGNRKLD